MHKKFLFEESFDDARPMTMEDDPNDMVFNKTQLDQATAQAFAEGKAAGIEEAKASFEKRTNDTCEHIASQIQMLLSNYGADIDDITEKSTGMVLFSLRKLVPELFARNAVNHIEGAVRQCFEFALEMPRLTIRIHSDVADEVEKRLLALIGKNGYAGKIVIQGDSSLTPGDCRIEWGNGGLENMPSESWNHIEQLLAASIPPEKVATIPTPTDPEPPPLEAAPADLTPTEPTPQDPTGN